MDDREADRNKVTEDRKGRRVHPYKRPEQSDNSQGQEYPTFDLDIGDLKDLMKCHTTASFRKSNKTRANYIKQGLSKHFGRFSNYIFKRSSVLDAEMFKNRPYSHSKSSVVEASPRITDCSSSTSASPRMTDCSSSTSATKLHSSFESEDFKPAAVIETHPNVGSSCELRGKSVLTVSDVSVQGSPSGQIVETTGNQDSEIKTETLDHCSSPFKESALVPSFSGYDQNSVDSSAVEDSILTSGDLVNNEPSQNVDVIDTEVSTNAIEEFVPLQTEGPQLINDTVVPHNAHETVPTVSSELLRSACDDQRANSVSTLEYDASPENIVNTTGDEYGILLPSDSHPFDCETTEGILSHPIALIEEHPYSQLSVSQVCAEDEQDPGSPLSLCSSVYSDSKEEFCQSGNGVTQAGVSSGRSSPGELTFPETCLDSQSIPAVENTCGRDGLVEQKTQLSILKQLISKVEDMQEQISQNARSSSLFKAIEYLKEKSKNFTTLSCTVKGKIVPSVMSGSKLHHVDSVTRTQSNSAKEESRNKDTHLRLKDTQPLLPKEESSKKLLIAQQTRQEREQNIAGHRQRKPYKRTDNLHPHHRERRQPKRTAQEPTDFQCECVEDSDLESRGYRIVKYTIDPSGDSRHQKYRRKHKQKKKPQHSKSLVFEEFNNSCSSPVITRNQPVDVKKTYVISTDSSSELVSSSSSETSIESGEIKEKRKKRKKRSSAVTRNKLSRTKLQGVVEPSSLVATNRGVVHEPTQVINGSSLQSSSEKGSLQDCSVTTSREVPQEIAQGTSDKHGQSPPVLTSHEVTLGPSKATANSEFWESVERNIDRSHDTSVVTCSAVPDVLSQEVISEVVPEYSDTAISKTVNPDKITISKVADKDIVTNLCVGTQKKDDLKPCAGSVLNKTLSNFTSDTVNVAERLTAGEHYVNEFRKKNILRSVNVTHTHSKGSNVVSCCQEQQMTIPSEVIGTEIRRIRKMQQTAQNQISQKMNRSLLKTCKQYSLPCVKCQCSTCIAHAENHQYYSEYPLGYGGPELYESKSSLSKASAFSRHALRSFGRIQPCTKIPSRVSETANFQPPQSETFFNDDSSDQYVGDCMKPSEDELFEDVLHSATHQSQKQPTMSRGFLKTSQLHPPSYLAQLKKLPPQQEFTQWDVGLPPCYHAHSGCSHTQTECLSGDILQDCCRSHIMSHPQTSCSHIKDTSRKRNHSRSLGGANTRHCSNPKKNSIELSQNEVAVTDDCLHAGKSSPRHIKNMSSDSTNEEGMLKAEILLDCLIKEIQNNVRQSSQNVDTRQRYSETEQFKHNLSSLQESSCYNSDFSRQYDNGGNHHSWKIKDSESYLAHRKHAMKATALDCLEVTNDDAQWSPWKVNKKHHAKTRKTKHAMLKSPDDEDNMRYQSGNSPLIRKRSARAHSKSKYSRKVEAHINDPVEDTGQDVSRTPSKKHKKKHSRKKSKHGSKHHSKHGSSGTLKSMDDTNMTTNDHFDNPDSYSLPSTDGKMSDSALKEHLRKAEAILDFPSRTTCHDIRWTPARETGKRKHKSKCKPE